MNFPLLSRAAGTAAARPVNVLYVVSHDLGRFLGTYGSGIATPNLDAFGDGGVVFTNAHCTSPACSPSRGCVMTGMYAHNNGLMGIAPTGPAGWHLPETNITQVDLFNAAGYETINVGGQHARATTAHMRYQVIRDYIDRNDSRVVMLTATPYNKQYEDLSNQLRLFVDEKRDLGVRPEECAMVGDSLRADVGGAGALGMTTIWRRSRVREGEDRFRPDHIIETIADIKGLPPFRR
jgi:hypothetical protein